jgi:hypothetical protein
MFGQISWSETPSRRGCLRRCSRLPIGSKNSACPSAHSALLTTTSILKFSLAQRIRSRYLGQVIVRLSVRDKDMPWQERAAPTLQDYSHQFRFFARLSAGKHAQNPKWCSRLEDKALVVARSCYPLRRTCSERPSYSTSRASLLVKYRPCPRERIGRFAQRHCNSRQARWHSTP